MTALVRGGHTLNVLERNRREDEEALDDLSELTEHYDFDSVPRA